MFLLLNSADLFVFIRIYYYEATTGTTLTSANDKQKETDITSMLIEVWRECNWMS